VATAVTAQEKHAAELNVLARKQRSLWGDAMYRLLRNRAALVGLIVIAVAALVAIFAPVLAPYGPLEQHGKDGLMEPIWTKFFGSKYTNPAYVFGSDELGRDILSRLMYSSRVSLIIGFVPVSIVLAIGLTVGMLAGYVGGAVDDFLMRVTDVVYAFPDLLFVIIIVATLRGTALGEAYDMNAMTCAHRTLPLGSLVRVTNLRNHRSLVLRVNDRGPMVETHTRVVDLSYAAAKRLGFSHQGTVRVRLDLVDTRPAKN